MKQAFYLILFSIVSFVCIAEDSEIDSIDSIESVDTLISTKTAEADENSVKDTTITEPLPETESTTAGQEQYEKPDGPVIGFVPEQAIENYKQYHQKLSIQAETSKLYQIAYEQQQKGLYKNAVDAYEKILLIEPEHQKSRIALARLYIFKQKYTNALDVLSSITEAKNDSHWSAWYWQGVAELMLNQHQKSATSLESALMREPEDASIWLLRAVVEQERGDHQTALQLLSIANQHDPKNPMILLNIALSHEAIGNEEDAANMYALYLQHTKHTQKYQTLNQSILNRMSKIGLANQP